MDEVDRRAGEPFSWVARADGTVIISYRSAPVTALRGQRAARFLDRVVKVDAGGAQQLMARATRKVKPGDERQAKG